MLEEITKAIESIHTEGDEKFCACLTVPFENLKLELNGTRSFQFPLTAEQITSLINYASPAHFGRRDKTLFDKTVRDVWEIKADQISMKHPSWESELNKTLSRFKKELGFAEQDELIPELHNFLIYEPGQFFKAHQDSEKCDGMVASLVIILPGKHTGGDFLIDHKGSTLRIQASKNSANSVCTFIGFYSDCHHEATPVESGYRMALTYNLVLKKNKILEENSEKYSATYPELMRALKNYFDLNIPKEGPRKLVYLLDHDYTEHGLSWDNLKGRDIETVKALRELAEILDLEIYLTLADVRENWTCDDGMNFHGYQYRGDDKIVDDEGYTLIDFIESETCLENWIDKTGASLGFKNIGVHDSEICWTKASDEFDPYESEYEGDMGNYGNTMDRWYHRAAIVLWRRDEQFAVLNDIDPSALMEILMGLIDGPIENSKAELRAIIREILPYWKGFRSRSYSAEDAAEDHDRLFQIAAYLQYPIAAQKLLAFMNLASINARTEAAILNLANTYGVSWCIDQFESWLARDHGSRRSALKDFSELVRFFNLKEPKIAQWLLDYQWDFIQAEDTEFLKKYLNNYEIRKASKDRCPIMQDYLLGTLLASDNLRHQKALVHLQDTIFIYPTLEIVDWFMSFKPDLKYKTGNWGHGAFFAFLVEYFKGEKSQGQRDPHDWSLREKSTCSCDDCKMLNYFLEDSFQKAVCWALAEKRRDHLVYKLDEACALVSHQVERRGSPYKLILTKKPEIHTRAAERYSKVLEVLEQLEEMAGFVSV